MSLRSLFVLLAVLWSPGVVAANNRPYVVVVDAGHGGHDPGAIAPSLGRLEKDATLAIATRVRDRLAGRRGIAIVLTRSDDRFLTLVARRRIAEAHHADLFISIHADSAPSQAARGASVYTLTEDGRAIVAGRLVTAGTFDGIRLAQFDRDTAAILGDIKQRGAMNDSALFAATLNETMGRRLPMRTQFQHTAKFAVLKAPGIPAALIETGYLTNPQDARTLFRKTGQTMVAKAIAEAIARTADARQIMAGSAVRLALAR